jgi:outer membrane protein OmpU
MKKVLFATSALVASAGFAAADVSLSGSAEMGITGGDGATETQFHQDIEVTFTMSGTTDNGLTFGASIQLDEAAWTTHTDDGGTSVFISGNMGTLTMGDTNGALDWATSEAPTGSGSIADNESSHSGYSGGNGLDGLHDGQILVYSHSIGALAFAASIELDDTGNAAADDVVGVGFRYSMGDLSVGVGFQSGSSSSAAAATALYSQQTGLEAMAISVGYSMGDLSLGMIYQTVDADGWADTEDHMGIGMSYTMDAITMGINYGTIDNVGGAVAADRAGWGFSAGYDLGGGASILLGYESTTDHETAASEDSTWSLGVSMSF